jgi:hypothetical protein
MVIARSPFSCASACGGNKARETLRYRGVVRCEEGWFPLDSERVSPNASKLDSASLHHCRPANLPKMGKPAIGEEEMSICTRRDGRGDWRGRALKDKHRYPGDPFRGLMPVVGSNQRAKGSHNLCLCDNGSRSGPYKRRGGVMPAERRGCTAITLFKAKEIPLGQ